MRTKHTRTDVQCGIQICQQTSQKPITSATGKIKEQKPVQCRTVIKFLYYSYDTADHQQASTGWVGGGKVNWRRPVRRRWRRSQQSGRRTMGGEGHGQTGNDKQRKSHPRGSRGQEAPPVLIGRPSADIVKSTVHRRNSQHQGQGEPPLLCHRRRGGKQ